MSEPLDWAAVRSEPLGARPAPVNDPSAAYPTPVGTPNPRARKHLSAGLIAVLVTVAMLAVIGLGVGAWWVFLRADTFTGAATLSVPTCDSPGHSDIHDGVQATLTDASGKVVSAAGLHMVASCVWRMSFEDVPAGQRYYGLTIARRGTVQVTEAELRAGAALTLE